MVKRLDYSPSKCSSFTPAAAASALVRQGAGSPGTEASPPAAEGVFVDIPVEDVAVDTLPLSGATAGTEAGLAPLGGFPEPGGNRCTSLLVFSSSVNCIFLYLKCNLSQLIETYCTHVILNTKCEPLCTRTSYNPFV
jgi:hypothetical protein